MPFTLAPDAKFEYETGDCVFVGGIRDAIASGKEEFSAKVIRKSGEVEDITLYINNMNAVISEITASYNQRNAKRKKTEEDPTQPPLDATLGAESEPEASESTE
jgi:hypothetical protein